MTSEVSSLSRKGEGDAKAYQLSLTISLL